jgi:hypothetical protein
LILGFGLCQCSVDDRILKPGNNQPNTDAASDASPENEAGPFDAGDGGGSMPDEPDAAGGSGGAGGQPSVGGGGSGVVNECEVASRQIAIENPSFDSDATGWEADVHADEKWSSDDADGESSSGSLAVKNVFERSGTGISSAGSSQCLQIAPRTGYQVCADYLLANDAPEGAAAAINLVLFNGTDCTGSVSSGPEIIPITETGGWKTMRIRLQRPPANSTFQSMLVKLVSIKPHEQESLEVLFDNIRIGETDK